MPTFQALRRGQLYLLLGDTGKPVILQSNNHNLKAQITLNQLGIPEAFSAAKRFGYDRSGLAGFEVDDITAADAIGAFVLDVWPWANYRKPRSNAAPPGQGPPAGENVFCWDRGLGGPCLPHCQVPQLLRSGFRSFAVRFAVIYPDGHFPLERCVSVGLQRTGGGRGAGCERDYRSATQHQDGWDLVDNRCRRRI